LQWETIHWLLVLLLPGAGLKKQFTARKVSRQCPLILLLRVDLANGVASGR
jgi:hypothetical protein